MLKSLPGAAALLFALAPLTARADVPSGGADDPPAAPAAPAAASPAPAAPAAPGAAPDALPPICADRPTKSNNACTVDAGHFQYETDLFNGTFQRQGGVTTDTYYVTNPTLKYGFSKDMDLEVNLSPYEVVQTHDKFGNSTTTSGIGDLYLTLKYNFYNSADGKFSIAAIPYVKAPTARMGIGNGAWEGGVIAPISYKLTDAISLTTQPELDDLADASGGGHHGNTSQLIDLSYNLPHNVTVFGEVWGDWNFDPAGTVREYSADVAIAWVVGNYIQLDGGLNFGLNRDTPGVQVYFGLSQKF